MSHESSDIPVRESSANYTDLPIRLEIKSRQGMSVDLEDYYHAWALSSRIARSEWEGYISRVEENTIKVLELFAAAGVTATFFVLGWIAQRHPSLVRCIVEQGHELASHGYAHHRVGEQDPDDFFQDVRRTRLLLEDLSGIPINGFRAPNFSIDRSTWWAFERLADAGYAYSSSVHPIQHDHYGVPDAPLLPFQPTAADLVEIPVSTIEVLGRRVSCAGGGHFRLLPYRWSRWCLQRFVNSTRSPAAFYFHPWELDPDQPRVSGLPLRARIRHYTHLDRMEDKLRRLLADFRWGRFDEVFKIVPGRDSSMNEPCRRQQTA